LSRKWVDAANRNVHWAHWPKKRIMHRSMAMHNRLWKSVKIWIGLQSQTIQKLISGQTEIKKSNDLIKLSHRPRHWFMNSFVRWKSIRRNSVPRFGCRGAIKLRTDNKPGEFTQNIENKHHTSNRSSFCKGVKMQKGAYVLIGWQIMHVRPT
jgi:hypothetical protein